MPRNSSGTMTLPAGNPVVSGSTISTTWANSTLSDLSSEISDSASRSGKGSFTAPIRGANGTVAAPTHSFTNDTGTGAYLAAAGDLRFAISGVDFISRDGIVFPVADATISVSSVGGILFLAGNRNAADTSVDVSAHSMAVRTAGHLFAVQNGDPNVIGAAADRLFVDYHGLLSLASGAAAAAIQPASILTAVTPTAPWGTARAMGYWKDATGTVKIKGSAIWHTAAGVLTVLAAGFRPADQRAFVAFNRMRGGFVVLSVSSGGAVSLDAGTVVDGDEIYFDPISFLAEQ